jgi:hypothetical protein
MENFSHDYKQNMEELVSKTGLPSQMVFDYSGQELFHTYQRFYDFCQENLSNTYSKFNIAPAKFFYVKDSQINAWYSRIKDYRVIGIHEGAIHKLNNFFDANPIQPSSARLKEYVDLNDKFKDSINSLILQNTLVFIFYHELTHLIQRSEVIDLKMDELTGDATFSLENHILEMDADVYAAHQLTKHCVKYLSRLPQELQTEEILHQLFAISASGIFVFFLILNNNRPFYYKKCKHPHPIVRIIYVTHYMLRAAKSGYGGEDDLDRKILNDLYGITEELVKNSIGMEGLVEYATVLQTEKSNIESYIKELLKAGDSMNFLVRNRNMEL